MVEYRYDENGELRIAALFEYKFWFVYQRRFVLSASTKAVYKIAQDLDVPFYFVWYDDGPKKFRVWNVTETGIVDNYLSVSKHMSEKEYREFIENL